jgi:hypothetical protein
VALLTVWYRRIHAVDLPSALAEADDGSARELL